MLTAAEDKNGFWECSDALLGLRQRQIEVISLVAAGHSSGEAGKILKISARTVDRHVNYAMALLGARSRAHLVALCYWRGILRTGSWPPYHARLIDCEDGAATQAEDINMPASCAFQS